MTVLDFFFKGGPLMYVLLALSVVGLGLVIGKYRQFFKVNKLHKTLAAKIGKATTLAEIFNLAAKESDETPLSIVFNKVKDIADENYLVIKESIEATANIALHKLERGMGWISTISAIAPLVGFLGTVTGMVRVFMNIAAHSEQGIDISLLAGGIWEALLTTVGGLVVGIPAIMFYNDLVSHAENNAKFLQEQIDYFMILLSKEKK
jgi:biopolymer transport protein ExbB